MEAKKHTYIHRSRTSTLTVTYNTYMYCEGESTTTQILKKYIKFKKSIKHIYKFSS